MGTEITRFGAIKYGIVSRYTVLRWEDAYEYHALVAAPAAEHCPQGPTEEHLAEELDVILWRKRRLRLVEAASHQRGREDTPAPSQNAATSRVLPAEFLFGRAWRSA